MKPLTEFRDRGRVGDLVNAIRREADQAERFRFMEVCGTHTMAVGRHGLRCLLPADLSLLSGPGCPVCVTDSAYIDRVVALARLPDVTICTFGDLMRVPGSTSSLEKEKARGADVRVVLSPLEAVICAAEQPARRVVFPGIGFETTTPGVALAIRDARKRNLHNFFVLSAHKKMPPALAALAEGQARLDGLLLPGHVSAVLGVDAYDFLARDHGLACVVAGFEPVDILQGLLMMMRQRRTGAPKVENQYTRLVRQDGNPRAREAVREVFSTGSAVWRGLGTIPGSGLDIRESFAEHDARRVIQVDVEPCRPVPGCCCGDILQGLKQPPDCPLFGCECTPATPVGACMVSSEGSCAAYYRYGGEMNSE